MGICCAIMELFSFNNNDTLRITVPSILMNAVVWIFCYVIDSGELI